jgi:hypothetical protein
MRLSILGCLNAFRKSKCGLESSCWRLSAATVSEKYLPGDTVPIYAGRTATNSSSNNDTILDDGESDKAVKQQRLGDFHALTERAQIEGYTLYVLTAMRKPGRTASYGTHVLPVLSSCTRVKE